LKKKRQSQEPKENLEINPPAFLSVFQKENQPENNKFVAPTKPDEKQKLLIEKEVKEEKNPKLK